MKRSVAMTVFFLNLSSLSNAQVLHPAPMSHVEPLGLWSCLVQGQIGDLFSTYEGFGSSRDAAGRNAMNRCWAARNDKCYIKSCHPGI